MKKYKFRAEVIVDVANLIHVAADHCEMTKEKFCIDSVLREDPYPDVDVVFQSNIPYTTLLKLFKEVKDGHVMAESLSEIQNYTSERDKC